MAFVSQAQRRWGHTTAGRNALGGNSGASDGSALPERVMSKRRAKKKGKIEVDNKIKGSYGETILKKGKPAVVKINVKKHKGNRAELADTIKHELYHVKHPNTKEKAVQKAMPKEISREEQDRLISKLRTKKLNYKTGAFKRKLHIPRTQSTKPGDLINAANATKQPRQALPPGKPGKVSFIGAV